MYSSNSNGNNIPISYTLDQTLAHKSIFSENNPNPKQYDIPSSLFSLPSPYTQYDEYPILLQYFPDLLLQQQPHLMTNDDTTAEAEAEDEAVITTVDSDRNGADGVLKGDFNMRCESVATEQIQRKRSSKKDRHSKINTAHGLRDRRMRLSLEVARKFFDLQDMLGFDKASKTVEWLLIKSKIAIKELAIGLKHTSSSNGAHSGSPVSECEVVSGDVDHTELISKRSKPSNGGVLKEKKIKSRVLHKSPFHPLAREWREKARAKARARTREKRKLDESKICLGAMNQNLNQLGSWSSYEACEDLGNHSQNVINQSIHEVEELRSQEHQGARQGILGDCLVINSNWSPSINFNYQHNTGTSQEHQSTEIQFCGKPWEAYNNVNLL